MINISAADAENNLKPKISVLGIGGAGTNAVNNMVDSGLEGVDFIVANTDSQSLANSSAKRKIQLGADLTKGLGAGADPAIGKASAEESLPEIMESLADSNMVFITAGMGGGTGSGASPVIGRALREKGILTIGVVTKPFAFEGRQREQVAEDAIEELKQAVDTLIIIPNQNLFNIIDESTTLTAAFNLADEVLHAGVSSITDLITKQGRMNKDFADIREIVGKMGEAMMGTGEAEGENRAIEAAEKAISNPLLDNSSMKGAKGVLLNITGSQDITLFEVDAVTNRIRAEIDAEDEAEFIIGTTLDDSMGDVLKVSIVATGMTHGGGNTFIRQVPKAKPVRPGMDDDSQDITEISFEEEVEEEPAEEDLNDNDDIVIPVSLFSSGLDDDEEEEEAIDTSASSATENAFEDIEQSEDIPVVEKEESFLKISEDGVVTPPQEDEGKPAEELKIGIGNPETIDSEKESFMKRIMKSKEKKEEEVSEDKENYSDSESEDGDVELPDFLQR